MVAATSAAIGWTDSTPCSDGNPCAAGPGARGFPGYPPPDPLGDVGALVCKASPAADAAAAAVKDRAARARVASAQSSGSSVAPLESATASSASFLASSGVGRPGALPGALPYEDVTHPFTGSAASTDSAGRGAKSAWRVASPPRSPSAEDWRLSASGDADAKRFAPFSPCHASCACPCPCWCSWSSLSRCCSRISFRSIFLRRGVPAAAGLLPPGDEVAAASASAAGARSLDSSRFSSSGAFAGGGVVLALEEGWSSEGDGSPTCRRIVIEVRTRGSVSCWNSRGR